MTVWTVWGCVHVWPELGGGCYLLCIFQNKEDAEKYCEQQKREAEEDREDVSFYIEEWPLE